MRVTSAVMHQHERLATCGSVSAPTMKDPLIQKSLKRIEGHRLAPLQQMMGSISHWGSIAPNYPKVVSQKAENKYSA